MAYCEILLEELALRVGPKRRRGLGARRLCALGVLVLADYRSDVDGGIVALESRPRTLVFSNPPNPTGPSTTTEETRRLPEAITAETILIFDEAYYEYAAANPYCPDFHCMLKQHASPWWMLRTFSKADGRAGLRVGCGIPSDALLADLMDRIRSPSNGNRLARAAALAALHEMQFVRECVSRTIAEREQLEAALAALGYRTASSCANLVFVDAAQDTSAFALRRLSRGGIFKPWREPGFEEPMPVSIGSPRANDRFQAAWNEAAERNSHVARKANV